jgi:hypothetical protein
MKHYGVAEWVDFSRGLVSDEDGLSMRSHLADGCSECEDLASFCDSLNGVRRQMETSVPPEWLVRNAKALFPIHAAAEPQRASRLSVQLIYDSFLAPEPAGLRATWQLGWQALYRAGDCSLDLRVEPELASSRAAVIGQISNHVAPGSQMENVPVYLKSGKSVVAETRSNRFGEFQMEYEQQGRLQLCVYLEDGSKCFQVPLKKFAADKTLGAERLGINTAVKPKVEEQ